MYMQDIIIMYTCIFIFEIYVREMSHNALH